MQDWVQFLELIAIPAFGLLFWYVQKVQDKSEKHGDKAIDHADKSAEKLNEEMESVRTQLGAWQIEVMRTYATRAEVERLENRIVGAIERLEKKIDSHFLKIGGVSAE